MKKGEERIKLETEMLKLIVLVALAIGGGSFGLLLGAVTPFRAILAGLGLSATLVLVIGSLRKYERIRILIDEIEEEL